MYMHRVVLLAGRGDSDELGGKLHRRVTFY